MATKIIHKKSSTASSVPASGDIEAGEIALNLADKKIYTKTTGGTVIELADGDKLAGIESGATADQTASEILTEIKTVDGSGSGLDADLLDGQQGSYYYPASNPNGYTSNIGDITGVTAGSGISGGGTSGTVTISHSDTSSQASVNNSGGTVIQDVTLDTYGHVTSLASKTLTASDVNALSSIAPATIFGSSDGITFDPDSGGITYASSGAKFWSELNDGSGSGLDADKLDGLHESTFMRRSANSQLDMNNNDIVGVDQIVHEGDSNTYMQFHAADQWRVVTGGAERLEVNNSLITSTEPVSAPSFSSNHASVSGTSFNLDPQAATAFTQAEMTADASFTIGNPANAVQEILFITEGGADTPTTDGSDSNIGPIRTTTPAFFSDNISGTFTNTKFCYNDDGSKVYVWAKFTGVVYQYSLSTDYDLNTASYDSKSFNLGSSRVYDGKWNNNGTKFFYATNFDGYLYYRSASTAYDISSLGAGSEYSFTSGPSNLDGFTFNNAGTELMLVYNNTFYTYGLSTAFDPSTATFQTSFSNGTNSISNVDISPDGRWIIAGRFGNFAGWYLSTANDLSTATDFAQYTFYQSFNNSGIRDGIAFDRDNPRIVYTTGYREQGDGSVPSGTLQHNKIYFGSPYELTTSETISGTLAVTPFDQTINRLLTTDTGATWKVI